MAAAVHSEPWFRYHPYTELPLRLSTPSGTDDRLPPTAESRCEAKSGTFAGGCSSCLRCRRAGGSHRRNRSARRARDWNRLPALSKQRSPLRGNCPRPSGTVRRPSGHLAKCGRSRCGVRRVSGEIFGRWCFQARLRRSARPKWDRRDGWARPQDCETHSRFVRISFVACPEGRCHSNGRPRGGNPGAATRSLGCKHRLCGDNGRATSDLGGRPGWPTRIRRGQMKTTWDRHTSAFREER